MAKGSHTTRGGWEPRTCNICGGPIRVSNPDGSLWFHYNHDTGIGQAWHVACLRLPERQRQRREEQP